MNHEADATETMGKSENITDCRPTWEQRYIPVRPLGAGGMGRVQLMERRSDSLLVCLKFLNPDTDARTLEQECRALMRLRHPSIVSLVDFSLEDKPQWLATEYVNGSTLQAYLKEHKALPVEKVLAILKSMLEALDYAHGEGVIHRDLKPANLMVAVAESGVSLRILDFGIAIVDQFDHTGRITAQDAAPLGTVLYMAPEQLEGQLLTSACDLYAVGLMTWEMLTGQPVYEGKKLAQVISEKVTGTERFAFEGTSVYVPAKLRSFVEECTFRVAGARPTAQDGLQIVRTL